MPGSVSTPNEPISANGRPCSPVRDIGHFLRANQVPVLAVEVFGRRIYGVHLKDVKDARTSTILGDGDLKLGDLLQALVKLKYNHCKALEYEERERNPNPDFKKCLMGIRNALDSVKD